MVLNELMPYLIPSTGIVLSVKMQAERKVQALEKENSELKEEVEQLKTKCAQLEV